MPKLIALYKHSQDPQAFDEAYFKTHLPLITQVPGYRDSRITRFTGAPRGEPEYYLMAEMEFDDLERAMTSQEMAAAGKNLADFAPGLFTLLYGQEEAAG